jgi:hypothetical protein
MKNLPAITSIATLAVLLLLAVAASVIDSIPFAIIASYVVGFGCSIGFLAVFLADYDPRSPRPVAVVTTEAEARRKLEAAMAAAAQHELDGQMDTPFGEPVTVNLLSTMGLRNDPATLSLS